MTAKSPVALIIGAGPNIGQSLIRKFASKGFKVGVAARSVKESDSTDTQLNITSDFSKTEDVVKAFDKVKQAFGIPSVVIYNGKCPMPNTTLTISLSLTNLKSAKAPSHQPITPSP
jgi:NAD(P)-dependent dehydrogenase (short-subunit alcohol dehydrogenase family)